MPTRKKPTSSIPRPASLAPARLKSILDRLEQNKPVRRALPGWGRIHIDRQLPFLCVYRRPADRPDPGTDTLCVVEAAYVLAPGDKASQPDLRRLVRAVADLMVERFGAFLIVELWSSVPEPDLPTDVSPRFSFTLHRPPGNGIAKSVEVMQDRLAGIKAMKKSADVATRVSRRCCPPGLTPLIKSAEAEAAGIQVLGLEIAPVFVNRATDELYPLLLRTLRRQLGHTLDRVFYEFAHERTTHQPRHYHALGRRAMVKAVWEVDRRLAAVSNSFDFLYQVTPLNAEPAWHSFRRRRFEVTPSFQYRPRAVDPGRMKRALYDIPIERVEDPTLMHLFLAKQMELDRQLTMLQDLGTPAFLYGSLQTHGRVSPPLLRTARQLLRSTPPQSRTDDRDGRYAAAEFAGLARREIEWYRRRWPDFTAKVRVARDMYSGLMVSRGSLLVGKDARIPRRRADALLQHEIGTHMLTYYNGRSQPFKMLYTGLPGYDELQEGLAVLAEYLAGGLGVPRLRILAARVIAAHALVDGASFVEVFRLLDETHGFTQRAAYTVTMRVFRGGGLVKDAVYLRGLMGILAYLGEGGELQKLLIGKIAADHVGMIEELMHRRILRPAPVSPRYLESAEAKCRLTRLRGGKTVLDLIKRKRKTR